ncbi:MAG: hypothetical protein NDI61_11750 [Bdellovibrionaceae bacterium]|nr:hypothetical protein [Pseudobdellovibrionaceae bacterium]
MKDTLFQKFCKVGQEADALFHLGRYREAHVGYARLLQEIENSRLVDSYLLSKITLGLLMTHIKLGEYPQAFAIWNSTAEDSLFGLGIYGLEHAQTSVQDMICYDFVCAFLHSLSAGDKDDAATAVNQYMSRICEHFFDLSDEPMLRLAISNWKQHLKEIFGSSLPHASAKPLIETERRLMSALAIGRGGAVRLQGLGFPPLSAWEKPEGFREVSHIIPFQPLDFAGDEDASGSGGAVRKLKR